MKLLLQNQKYMQWWPKRHLTVNQKNKKITVRRLLATFVFKGFRIA